MRRLAVIVVLASALLARAGMGSESHGTKDRPPPRALQRLESAAEDAGDAAAKRDWAKADAIARGAQRDLDALARKVGREPVAAARRAAEAMRKAIAARSTLDAQFAANALSRDVVGLFAAYRTVIPLDVMRLDVLLRQVQLEAEAGSPARASASAQDASKAWSRVRASLPQPGAPAARRFEREMRDVLAATSQGDAATTSSAASAALEGVDGLEGLYRAPASGGE